eukprot:TRINITY_DN5365_c0_g1_i1.p1 TRINITY_DN5365_c0_g1~~TRINITY_DN5365_c0_g1_i1.p1  ORF type:complete len:211 (+),score=85.67 TRINITY_DN5365_c0_g1_i1:117-749(+)
MCFVFFFFFFKQKTAYEMLRSLVGSEMCIKRQGINAEYGGARRPSMSSNDRLHTAARAGNTEEVLMLLEAKANPNQEDRGFNVPLDSAAMSGKIEIVRALLHAKASVNRKGNGNGTALMVAATNGHEEVAVALVEAGAAPQWKADDGNSAADLADEGGFEDLAQWLKDQPPVTFESESRSRTFEEWVEYYMQDGNMSKEEASDLAELECL